MSLTSQDSFCSLHDKPSLYFPLSGHGLKAEHEHPAVQLANAPLTVVVGTLMHSSQVLRTIAIAYSVPQLPVLQIHSVSFARFRLTEASAIQSLWRPPFLSALMPHGELKTWQKLNNQRHNKQSPSLRGGRLVLRERVLRSLPYPCPVYAAPNLVVGPLSSSSCSPAPMLQGVTKAPANNGSGFAT
jgi:hypothetical protein